MSEIMQKFSLQGQAAVVTGGGGLLGKEFCRTLAQAGAGVVVADLNGELAESTAEEICRDGGQAVGVGVDVTRSESTQAMVAACLKAYGKVDVLVCSAALDPKVDPGSTVRGGGKFEDYPLDQWKQALDVNLTGLFLSAQAASRPMVAQGGGSMIFICSTYGLAGPDQRIYRKPGQADQPFKPVYYSVTKAGVLGLVRYLAAYYAGTKIRANALTPGGVFNNHDETFVQNYAYRTIMGRMANKDEMNGALLFLASEASSYMTGSNVVVDGGWTAWVDHPEVLAIIPARGGSKGLPRKNIRNLAGYPLISYSIAAGLQAGSVTRTIVSTDDEEIAAVARKYGAETPFLRPAEFAQDNTLDLPVFQHALHWLAENEGYHPEVVVQLRPTSPVRPPSLVDDAVRLLLVNPAASSVRGLVPSGQNPHKMWRVDPETGSMRNLIDVAGVDEPYNAPRQSLPQTFWQTGHIDAIRPAVILEQGSMSGTQMVALMIDPRYAVDIDQLLDLQKTEWLIYNTGLDMVHPGHIRRHLPEKVSLIVFDFDGVMTDNRVWVDQDGREMVAANRSDSLGLEILREQSAVQVFVMSKETNPVVAARCRKMKVPMLQAVDDKAAALRQLLVEKAIDPSEVIYMGNDTNDLPCFPLAGCAVVPADAQPQVLFEADIILKREGGRGAVRELCDMLLARYNR